MDTSALLTLSYGLYVVGTESGGKLNGQISNTVFQITAQPVRVAVSINRTELTHELITATRRCCVGVLGETADLPFIGRFGFRSGRDADKFDGIRYRLSRTGCPIPSDHILSYLDLSIVEHVDMATHTVFMGEVTDCGVMAAGRPMTYAYYREVLQGKTPPTAPSHKPPSCDLPEVGGGKEKSGMDCYVCNICGYVYDPDEGDPDGGIPPDTAFEDLPDEWVCPVCGVGKDQFAPE